MPPERFSRSVSLTSEEIDRAVHRLRVATTGEFREYGFGATGTATWTEGSWSQELQDQLLEERHITMDKSMLKKRHLNREERQILHKPRPDWIQTEHGEVCRSASSLVVDDLVSKYR